MNLLHLFIHTAYAASESAPSGPVELLGLDWHLFIAQLINFVIVLLVLWRWVFKPIGKKLEERANKIEESQKQMQEIAEKHAEAEKFRLAEIEKARDQASEIVNQAQRNAAVTKQQIIEEAKAAAQKQIDQAKLQIESEKNKLIQEVREEAATMVAMATEKIIGQKVDLQKDGELIKKTLEKVK